MINPKVGLIEDAMRRVIAAPAKHMHLVAEVRDIFLGTLLGLDVSDTSFQSIFFSNNVRKVAIFEATLS